jgi:hypothetical protein
VLNQAETSTNRQKWKVISDLPHGKTEIYRSNINDLPPKPKA